MKFAAALGALLLLAGCQVSTNDEPRAISTDAVPFGLLEETPASTSTTVPVAVAEIRQIYLLENVGDGSRVIAVEREFTAGKTGPGDLLAALVEATPNDVEQARGINNSAFSPSAEFVSATLDDSGVLTVEIRGLVGDDGIAGPNLRLSMGQIVYTATEGSDDVNSVRFVNEEGQTLKAVIDDSQTVDRPVDTRDYRNIRPQL